MLQKSATRHSAAPGKAVALGLAAISSISFLVPTRTMAAEHPEERDLLLLEAGTAGQRELTQGTTYFGPTVGVEVEPIENWLEVELGAARFRNADATVWDLDMPFKKPWRLSQTLEVMPGVGPTWEHTSARGHADTWGAEAVIDLFFWHSKRFGWFVEPAYGVAFNAGRSKFFAITAGLFFTVL